MNEHNGNGKFDSAIVKVLLLVMSFMGGCLTTGALSWATYVRSAVTLSQVDQEIDTKDKAMQVEIDTLTRQCEQINAKLDYLIENPAPPRRK